MALRSAHTLTRQLRASRSFLRQQRFASPKIIYTLTDEAPALATYSLLPIIRRFTDPAGIAVEQSDISVAARILAHFPECLKPEQRVPDTLAELGVLALTPEANIIKLPNVSASIPQLKEAIAELQEKGYAVPDFHQEPTTDAQKAITNTYAKVLGSAVNPVLREGNSDRRVALPVKKYAQNNPHKMGAWSSSSRTHVSSMENSDFFATEKSAIMEKDCTVKIEFVAADGSTTVLKEKTPLMAGEVIDAAVMDTAALQAFFEKELQDAKAQNIMVSLHLKATMMKISDPIMFGHAVKVYFKDAFAKHAAVLSKIGANPNNGLGDVFEKVATLPEEQRKAIEADFEACYATRPGLAMVDSNKGITNLHVPSDVIIDASMPCVMRDSGMMWNKDDKLEDTKCMIPDRCYAGIYQQIIDFSKQHGQFDVTTMGNVANVGLMAQKAEEYGSHDKTFEISKAGTVRVVSDAGNVVFEHSVKEGDIWRMCQCKDAPIKDWVRLAVSRARATGAQTIFWLTEERAHDRSIISKVNTYLKDHNTEGLDISIMAPEAAIQKSMERAKAGLDTISCTGNVLRDYLTDLFPILELGTSAKMLSIVPLLAGGGLFETGAGGSAPKHVQQLVKEGHLRWDSLGEYLAMAVSLEDLGEKTGNARAMLLGQTLTEATGKLLENRKSPSRKVKEIDNRGSNFYVALYWAEAMAKHDSSFQQLADQLAAGEAKIVKELIDCQGKPTDIGGYYMPDPVKAEKVMRISETFNHIIDN